VDLLPTSCLASYHPTLVLVNLILGDTIHLAAATLATRLILICVRGLIKPILLILLNAILFLFDYTYSRYCVQMNEMRKGLFKASREWRPQMGQNTDRECSTVGTHK
jgi:hypothetical protein